jgi:hypothetical protein
MDRSIDREVNPQRGQLRRLGVPLEAFGAELLARAARQAGLGPEQYARTVAQSWTGDLASLRAFERVARTAHAELVGKERAVAS